MDSGFAALAGALGGAIVTGLLTWLASHSTSRRAERAQRKLMGLGLCTQFLSSIDADIRGLSTFEESRGGMPVDHGYEFKAKAVHELAALELGCPKNVFISAQEFVSVLYSYADGPTTYPELQSAREAFLRTVRDDL